MQYYLSCTIWNIFSIGYYNKWWCALKHGFVSVTSKRSLRSCWGTYFSRFPFSDVISRAKLCWRSDGLYATTLYWCNIPGQKIKITVVHKILAMFHRLKKTTLPTFWWSFKGNISNIIFSLDTEQYFSYNWLLGQHLGQIPEQNIFFK